MPGSTYLAILADAARDLVLAVLILATLTAVLLRAAFDLGIRAAVQQRWVHDWLRRRQAALRPGDIAEVNEIRRHLDDIGANRDVYSLDYRQICGQIASAVQAQLSYPKGDSPFLMVFAARADTDDRETLRALQAARADGQPVESDLVAAARQRVAYHAEKGVDELQANLGRSWARLTYDLALAVTFGLTSVLAAVLPQEGLGTRVVVLCLMGPCVVYLLVALQESGKLRLPYAAAIRAVLPLLFVAILLMTPLLQLDPTLRTLEITALISYAGGLLTPIVSSLLDRVYAPR